MNESLLFRHYSHFLERASNCGKRKKNSNIVGWVERLKALRYQEH